MSDVSTTNGSGNGGVIRRMRLIGLAVVVGIVAFTVLAYTRPNPFADSVTVRAVFDDYAGTGVVNTEVRAAGTVIGKVTDARRAGDDAIVTMEIEPDEGPVHRDARAVLRPRLAFEGTAFIELDRGTPARGELGDRPIPRSRTRNYVALDQALRVARPGTRRALQADVRQLGRALAPEAQQGLQTTLEEAPRLTHDLALGARAALGPHRDELSGVVEGFADTMAAVQREEDSLTPILRGARDTLAAMNADAGAALEATLENLPGRLANIRDGSVALHGVIDRLDPLATDLRPGMAELQPALAETRSVLEPARPALRGAPELLRELRRAVEAGGDTTPRTRAFLREVDPLVDLLETSLLPALLEPTKLGIPTYRQFFALFQGGAGAFRSFQTADAGDPSCRGPSVLDPSCQKVGVGHYARFGAIFDIARPPVLPCDPEKARCSPVQDEEEARGR